MADASAKAAGPSAYPAKGPKKVSFSGKVVKMGAGVGEASKWKKEGRCSFSS
jgi:hypothetical protein